MVAVPTLAVSSVIGPAMRELADHLRPVLEPVVTVYGRPVDKLIAPAAIVTAGEPLLQLGGTYCLYELHLAVAVVAGRFDAAGTWDTLIDVAETVQAALETLDGCESVSLGRVGPVAVAGVDYLAGIHDVTLYRN